MGRVILSTEEYNTLKEQANLADRAMDCFTVQEDYSREINLVIDVQKGAEIFKALFARSKFNNEQYEVIEKDNLEGMSTLSLSGYYFKAVKKEEPEEPEQKEVEEDVEDGNN